MADWEKKNLREVSEICSSDQAAFTALLRLFQYILKSVSHYVWLQPVKVEVLLKWCTYL